MGVNNSEGGPEQNKQNLSYLKDDTIFDEKEHGSKLDVVLETKNKSRGDQLVRSEFLIRQLNQEYFYGLIDTYPEELRTKVRENSEILYSLEKDIISDRKNMNDIDIIFNNEKIENFISNEISYDDIVFSSDKNMTNIFGERFEDNPGKCEDYINNAGYTKDVQDFLLRFAKFTSKYEIENRENTESFFPGYQDLISGTAYNIGKNGENNILDVWKSFIQNTIEIFSPYLKYIPKRIFDKFVKSSIKQIITIRKEKIFKERLVRLNKYLNHYCYGEDRGINLLNNNIIATVFSFDKINNEIEQIINNLGYSVNIDGIDVSFINRVFIHQTDVRVLKYILKEGGLVSTNEVNKRGRDNEDIRRSISQKEKAVGSYPHKDIYFYAGYQPDNIYGHSKNVHDMIFFANTMNSFARKGYGVPLNNRMQAHPGSQGFSSDMYGYSIISDSSLKNYGKIDVNDLFLFISEKKKNEIESNLSIDSERYNIVYIPEECYEDNKLSDKVYKFIEDYVKSKNDESSNIIPYNIILNQNDSIDSANNEGSWAFCKIL